MEWQSIPVLSDRQTVEFFPMDKDRNFIEPRLRTLVARPNKWPKLSLRTSRRRASELGSSESALLNEKMSIGLRDSLAIPEISELRERHRHAEIYGGLGRD